MALVLNRRGSGTGVRRPGELGLSLIEVLIASGLLLIVAVGILPLMMRAMANNVQGWDATVVSNDSRSLLDDTISGPLDAPDITLPAGSNVLQFREFWADGTPNLVNDPDEGWYDPEPTDKGLVLWERLVRVRQYSLIDFDDMQIGALGDEGIRHYVVTAAALANKARDGSTLPAFIHVKQIEVEAEGTREGGGLGSSPKLYVRLLKAY